MNVLVNYDLHKRVITITLDNASTNNIAIELMRHFLSGFHDELFHVRCGYHIINLIVNDRLKLVQDPINKLRSSIVYLFNSNFQVDSFKILCRIYNRGPTIFRSDKLHK